MAIGFWAVLLQSNDSFVKNMVVYANNSRNPAKRNHGLTEQEGLGVVWEVQKISPYLYGRHFLWSVTIIISAGSPGLQNLNKMLRCWILPQQEFNFTMMKKS